MPGEQAIVSLHVSPLTRETMIPEPELCPRLRQLEAAVLSSLKAEHEREFGAALKEMDKLFAVGEAKLDATQVADIIMTRAAAGFPPIAGLSSSAADAIVRSAVWRISKTLARKDLLAVAIGPFLAELKRVMVARLSGPGGPLLRLYSAHDTTISALVTALGTELTAWPKFGASVILELFRKPFASSGQEWFFRCIAFPRFPFLIQIWISQ